MLNYAPWVANLARFQAVFYFGLEQLLEAAVVVRQSIAAINFQFPYDSYFD